MGHVCSEDKVEFSIGIYQSAVHAANGPHIFIYIRENWKSQLIIPVLITDNNYVARNFFCEFNGIDDFKVDGEYVIYDSIRPIIEISSVWSKLGSGADASVLSKAQENANNGVPTVAIDVSQSYGLVVLILPGEAKKASKWDGNLVPNAACFTHVKSSTPFINKSVAYAFRTSENIVFYSR